MKNGFCLLSQNIRFSSAKLYVQFLLLQKLAWTPAPLLQSINWWDFLLNTSITSSSQQCQLKLKPPVLGFYRNKTSSQSLSQSRQIEEADMRGRTVAQVKQVIYWKYALTDQPQSQQKIQSFQSPLPSPAPGVLNSHEQPNGHNSSTSFEHRKVLTVKQLLLIQEKGKLYSWKCRTFQTT